MLVNRLHSRSLINTRSYSVLQRLSDEFLDLASALPLPPSVPPYSTTIILVTVFTRLAFTLPVSIWAKKRERKTREIVMPHIEKLKPLLAQSVLREMQLVRVTGTKESIKAEHAKRLKQLLTIRRNQLLKEHHCQPLPTMLAPVLSQLPVFVLTTAVLAKLSQPPTPFDSESFLTLTTLAHADPTTTFPIVLGIITMVNVESSRWMLSEEEQEREKKVNQWSAEKRAQGHRIVEPKKHLQSALRLLSVGRILLGALVPGSIVLYWVTSATFGLIQTWLFDWWELRRRRKLLLQPRTSPPSPKPHT